MASSRRSLVSLLVTCTSVVACSAGTSDLGPGGGDDDAGNTVESADGGAGLRDDASAGGDASLDGAASGDATTSSSDAAPGSADAGHMDAGGSHDGGASDSGGGANGPISCPGPGTPKSNGGSCGTERWNIKTGTDQGASSVSLVLASTTIASLVALPASGGGSGRESPTETTIWELKDVTLSMIKLESDSDYHMVVSDGTHSMIVEVPYPSCATGSAWSCFISRARSTVDAKLNVSTSPQYPALTVTVRGVGFFDYPHGQTGEAPNSIELHPVLQLCFGQGCTPG